MVTALIIVAVALALVVYGGVTGLPGFGQGPETAPHPTPRMPRPPAAGSLAARLGRLPLTRGMDSAAFYRLQAGLGLVTGGLYLLAAPGPTTPLLWGTAALAGLAAASLPRLWLRLQEHRASLSLEAGFRDLLGHLAVQTAAGIPLLHALAAAPAVVREPLRREVEALVADLRLSPLPAAMERFAARTGHPEIATFAQHVAHAQRVGIALPDLLREEEKHALAIYRQAVRRRIKAGALTMALVTVILLVNGLLIYGTPLAFTILEFISGE